MTKIKPLERLFRGEKPFVERVYEDQNARVVRFYLKKGQEIRPHRSPSSVFVTLLSGQVKMTIGDEELVVERGATVCLEPQELHGFTALEDSIIEAVIAPPPGIQRLHPDPNLM